MEEVDQEVVREFLAESHENLVRLDQELGALEKEPEDAEIYTAVWENLRRAASGESGAVLTAATSNIEAVGVSTVDPAPGSASGIEGQSDVPGEDDEPGRQLQTDLPSGSRHPASPFASCT